MCEGETVKAFSIKVRIVKRVGNGENGRPEGI